MVSVSKLLNSATSQSFQKYFDRNQEDDDRDNNKSKNVDIPSERKKSAYSAAPHKISCPYCSRKFPWSSSLNRHILTHTGQKPYKCRECPLWFTTKSNCDRHVIRYIFNLHFNLYCCKQSWRGVCKYQSIRPSKQWHAFVMKTCIIIVIAKDFSGVLICLVNFKIWEIWVNVNLGLKILTMVSHLI